MLAQHLDDLAESLLMSAFHNGVLRTMQANYVNDKGDVRIIRPLCYAREHQTKAFSYAAKLPVINENCPACFEAPKERHRIKKLLAKEESLFGANIFDNLRRAMVPLMDPMVAQLMPRITVRNLACGAWSRSGATYLRPSNRRTNVGERNALTPAWRRSRSSWRTRRASWGATRTWRPRSRLRRCGPTCRPRSSSGRANGATSTGMLRGCLRCAARSGPR